MTWEELRTRISAEVGATEIFQYCAGPTQMTSIDAIGVGQVFVSAARDALEALGVELET
jgi:hypothetical protein